MSSPGLLENARQAVRLALGAGAREAAAGAYRVRHVEVQWRDGALEKVSEATTRGVGLELYVEGRYSAVSTSDLRPEALERFIGHAVALARTLAPDPDRALPDPALYAGRAQVDLDLDDRSCGELDGERRRSMVREVEASARAVKGSEAILSVTTGFSDALTESARVHSNGFEGERRATDFGMSAQVSVRDPDGRRPEEWDAAGAHHLEDLPRPERIGRTAAERALARIGAARVESGVVTLAVENRSAGRLVGLLLGPLSAASLQQRRSFMEGRLGERVGSALLDVRDDPLVPRGLGSRLHDAEGLAAKAFPVFQAGVLRTCYVDVYYGRKLGMAPTTRGMSNLVWTLGPEGRDGILARMGEGILVTGFLGGNSNGTTGDFSLGAQGFRVRAGRIAEPVGEMNVSGNHLELWKRLAAVGDDPYPWSAGRTPTLVFEGVQLAGL